MFRLFTAACCLLSMSCQTSKIDTDSETIEFAKWASENAVPLSQPVSELEAGDLTFLSSLADQARVVAIGESRHDAHEQFIFKTKSIARLIQDDGFNIIALEESFPYAEQINRFVLTGDGNLDSLMNGMGAWFIWDTEEIREMLLMLAEHNRQLPAEQKVRFAGIDITDPRPGLAIVTDYLSRVDPDYRDTHPLPAELYAFPIWEQIIGAYHALPEDSLRTIGQLYKQILNRLAEHKDSYVQSSSPSEYRWVTRNAENLIAAHDFFTFAAAGNLARAGEIREQAMAQNVLWHLGSAEEGNRMVIWAHNFHVNRDRFDLHMPQQAPLENISSMGKHLSDVLQDQYVSIGQVLYEGTSSRGPIPRAEPATVAGVLSGVDQPAFYLDLTAATKSTAAASWLASKQQIRGHGNGAEMRIGASFDALIFLRQVAPTRPTPLARQRFQQLRQ